MTRHGFAELHDILRGLGTVTSAPWKWQRKRSTKPLHRRLLRSRAMDGSGRLGEGTR